ncbi:MAG: ribose 5-phosphate isomerase B [Candidatus Krumholzibacteriia bacterium]
MKVVIGSDHRGYSHKERLRADLAAAGHEVDDCGCFDADAADYPDAAFAVGERVAGGRAERGILVCGSGIGVSIAANKVAGVRAALCQDVETARMTRAHNDSNVLCLSGDRITPEDAGEIAAVWLATAFEGGRHGRRVEKIARYEDEHCRRERRRP